VYAPRNRRHVHTTFINLARPQTSVLPGLRWARADGAPGAREQYGAIPGLSSEKSTYAYTISSSADGLDEPDLDVELEPLPICFWLVLVVALLMGLSPKSRVSKN